MKHAPWQKIYLMLESMPESVIGSCCVVLGRAYSDFSTKPRRNWRKKTENSIARCAGSLVNNNPIGHGSMTQKYETFLGHSSNWLSGVARQQLMTSLEVQRKDELMCYCLIDTGLRRRRRSAIWLPKGNQTAELAKNMSASCVMSVV